MVGKLNFGTVFLITLAIPVAAICLYFIVTIPPRGPLQISTISGSATLIYETDHGIPYINGTTKEAVMFALGFSHAADRLFSLHLRRASAYGTLSEIFGKPTIGLDKYIRDLQLEKVVDEELRLLKPECRSLLEAYTAGINSYVKGITMLPIEFWIQGTTFKPWMLKDSLMVFKLFAFEFSGNWKRTLLRTAVKEKMGEEWAERIVPTHNFVLEESLINIKKPREAKNSSASSHRILHLPSKDHLAINVSSIKVNLPLSNAWVIHGNYTDTHKPILANDPHFEKQMPGVFYMASLKFPNEGTVVGATLVGIPAVIIGRNEYLAWGISGAPLENIDVHEILTNENWTHYMRDGKWESLKMKSEIINVKDEKSMNYSVYSTAYGPIIQPADYAQNNDSSFSDIPKIYT